MSKPPKRVPNPKELEILRDLRDEADLSQDEAAVLLGLTGKQSRLIFGNWERGDEVPPEKHRAKFIDYLWFPLGQRRDINEFRRIWGILVEQWGWAPLNDDEDLPHDPPLKGLEFYAVEDAHLFFGREKFTADLVNHVRHRPVLVVVGASGSGKSSVVRAGLVAAMQSGLPLADGTLPPEGSSNWLYHIITPTATPLDALAESLCKKGESPTPDELAMEFRRDPDGLAKYVQRILKLEAPAEQPAEVPSEPAAGTRLFLVVDQFEELFTQCDDRTEQKAFVDNLFAPALRGAPVVVVMTLRADFYGRCADFNPLRLALQRDAHIIVRMSAPELRAAIEMPAHNGGWSFQPGLVDLMLDELGDEPGNLPLLSHALLATWFRRQNATLTLEGYSAVGRIKGAIAETANRVYKELNEEQQRIARRILLRLTDLGEESLETRHRVERNELVHSEEERAVVEAVLASLSHSDARLITISRDIYLKASYVEISHEALIRAWGPLKEWVEQERDNLLLMGRLGDAAKEWNLKEDDRSLLYRGTRLQAALEWAKEHPDGLNKTLRAFLDASVAEQEREQKEREDALRREKEQAEALAEEQRKRAVAARRALMAVSALLVVILVSGTIGGIVFYAYASQGIAIELLDGADILIRSAVEPNAQANAQEAKAKVRAAHEWSPEQVQARVQMTNPVEALNEALADVDRQIATNLVQEGEELLRTVHLRLEEVEALTPDEELRLKAKVRQAFDNFEAAQALKPPPDTPLYIRIEGGEFLMGAAEDDPYADADEKPQHWVTLADFWMSRTEVTNERFRGCVEVGECNTPNTRFFGPELADFPVTSVTFWQARNFARSIGGRLPTEAEWERACRGKEGYRHAWGNNAPTEDHVNPRRVTQEVGSYPAGATPSGLLDMNGNTGEWVSTIYDHYPSQVTEPILAPETSDRMVMRGQTFYGHDDCTVRTEYQTSEAPANAGFRVVFTDPFAEPVAEPVVKVPTP